MRGDDFIILGNITELQSAKQSVNEVEKDEECGLKYEGKPLIEVGDILNFYQEEKIINKF